MFSKIGTSLRGNTCAQVFTDGNGAVFAYPMKRKSEAGQQLINLFQQVGVPYEIHRDGALRWAAIPTLVRYAENTGYDRRLRNPTLPGRTSVRIR